MVIIKRKQRTVKERGKEREKEAFMEAKSEGKGAFKGRKGREKVKKE